MSWDILHDRDNLLRAGGATITSAPSRAFGSELEALTDGVQAIPCRFLGVQTREIVITLDGGPVGVGLISIHDLRVDGDNYDSVTVVGPDVTFTRQEIERARGSVAWVGQESLSEVRIQINPMTTDADWSLSEIALGIPWGATGDAARGASPAREVEFSRRWNTVQNGPWRTKIAEPMQTFALAFAAGHQRDVLEEDLERSEGGLRPVVLVPDRSRPKAIHGHLGDEFVASSGPGGLWREGVQLVVQEGMRALK